MALRKPAKSAALLPLPLPDDLDIIRFETNLLQIGFFSAHDPRYRNNDENKMTLRRLEQTITREGQKIRVGIEFESTLQYGLPSTADRDKFLALMKVISEERARTGYVANPVRFSGYRLLKELGLSNSGTNYADLYAWGRRLTVTTITSEKVIYLPSRKRYSDDTTHVFNKFRRVGESNLDDSNRTDTYEVELSDWLLENINYGYVVPENFTAYKGLTRPVAKGIFGNLHLWFHASQGRAVEKDYAELCAFLNIPTYPYLSKIKSTIGASLDELIKIQYLDSWQVLPMTTKKGFKIVMLPGEDLLRVINIAQKKQVADRSSNNSDLNPQQRNAFGVLLEQGILTVKARSLVMQYDPDQIVDVVEYSVSQIHNGPNGRQKIGNPAGFIIFMIESGGPVPATFISSRKRMELEQKREKRLEEEQRDAALYVKYHEWKDGLLEAELSARYRVEEMPNVLEGIIKTRLKVDPRFNGVSMPRAAWEKTALTVLKKELLEQLDLPDIETWKKDQPQGELF